MSRPRIEMTKSEVHHAALRTANLPEPLIDGARFDLGEAISFRPDRDVARLVRAYVLASGRALSASWRAAFAEVSVGSNGEAAVQAGLRAAVADELGATRADALRATSVQAAARPTGALKQRGEGATKPRRLPSDGTA